MNTIVIIKPPIKIIPSVSYALVIQDSEGVYHYFSFDGSYDGWSKDCKWSGARVKCFICNYEWIAVFLSNCERLECPHCHNMVLYEVIER